MKKLLAKATAVYVWATSTDGRKDIGALVAVVTAVYVGLHRAGAF